MVPLWPVSLGVVKGAQSLTQSALEELREVGDQNRIHFISALTWDGRSMSKVAGIRRGSMKMVEWVASLQIHVYLELQNLTLSGNSISDRIS